ncbi:hypothetical protein GCM10028857_29310 [Salinarchaeum chitinilyticum]
MVQTARNAQMTFLAAAVAYYAFLSLVPLLALALVISTAIGGEALVERLLARTDAVLTPETQDLLSEALVGGEGRFGATAFGAIAVSWSAMGVLRALDTAFSQVYGTADETTFLGTIRDGIVVIAAIVVGATAMAAVVVGVGELPLGPLATPVTMVLGVSTLTVIFLPMYYVFPDFPVSAREAFPGALTAALGWMLLGAGFSFYVEIAASAALYGVLGGIFLLITFLYAGAFVVVAGAVVNVVVGPDRQLQQGSSPGPGLTTTMAGAPGSGTDDEESSDGVEGPATGAGSDDAAGADDVAGQAGDRTVGQDAAEFDPGERTPEEARLREEVADLRAELRDFRDDVEDRTVERDTVESDLRRYVRQRVRRGHARGWGPYLVLLYGTLMTVAAFYFLSSGWAILAMLVIWLSTLGLYTLMVLIGAGLNLLGLPGRLRDRIGDWRS